MTVSSLVRNVCLLLLVGLLFQGCSRQHKEENRDSTVKLDAILARDADYQEYRDAAKREKLQEAYDKACVLTLRFSESAGAWSCKGYAADRLNRLEEAHEAYKKATELDPNYAKGWFNRGVIAGRLRKSAEEIQCYEKAVEVRPDYYKAWANLFSVYTETGNAQKAISSYQKVRQLFPRFEQQGRELAARVPPPDEAVPQPFRFEERIAMPQETEHRLHWNDSEMAQSALAARSSAGLSLVMPLPRPGSSSVEKEKAGQEMARVFNNRGMVAEERERWDEAILYYRLAARKLPREPMVWNNLGLAQIGGGDFKGAIDSFSEAAKYSKDASLESNLAVAHASLGAQLMAGGRDLEAMSHFNQALALQPNMIEPRVGLVSVLRRRQHWDEVRSQCEILLQTGQNSADLWYNVALANKALKDQPKTMDALQHAIHLRPDDAGQWCWYAVEQAQAGNFAKAAEAFEQTLKFDPKNAEAWYGLGGSEARQQHWDRALVALKKAVAINDKPVYQEMLAAAYESSGNSLAAIAEYKVLLKSNPGDPAIMKACADSYASNKQMNEAIQMYQKSLSLKEDSQTWAGLAYALQENGKFRESCDAYEKAVKLGENSPDIWNNLGVAHARLKEFPEALEAFTKAANGRNKDSELLFNIGMVFYHLGKKSEVQRTYRTLMQVDQERARELAAVTEIGR